MRLRTAIAPVLALALAGCGEEALRTGPIDSRILHSLASVHVDPPAAAAMLNAYRASRRLGPVRLDPALNAMAQRQADAMVAANALSHDVAGSFSSRLAGAGVDATEAGENVGGGYYSTEEALTGWRGSPEHDANLLIARATRFGIAVAKDARTQYRVYWAMEVAAEPQRPAGGPASPMTSSGGS
ncbi:MAG: CAP domain-containing protein [Roseiarcus sp.]|jgi:hypothetical protein